MSLLLKVADFLKEIGTLYDLLIYLLDNPMNTVNSVQIQGEFFKGIITLRIIILNLKNDIQINVKNKKRKFLQNKKMF